MNQSEKRRKQLLEQTKILYTDRKVPPAVHPRYGNIYSELYGGGEEQGGGTFGVRVMLCLLLFAVFAAMDYQDAKISNVTSEQIVEAVEYQPDVEEILKNL